MKYATLSILLGLSNTAIANDTPPGVWTGLNTLAEYVAERFPGLNNAGSLKVICREFDRQGISTVYTFDRGEGDRLSLLKNSSEVLSQVAYSGQGPSYNLRSTGQGRGLEGMSLDEWNATLLLPGDQTEKIDKYSVRLAREMTSCMKKGYFDVEANFMD